MRSAGKTPEPSGVVLRALREKAGVSQGTLARILGVSPAHICNVEHGRRGISPVAAKRLAEALGLPPDLIATLIPVRPQGRQPMDLAVRKLSVADALEAAREAREGGGS